MGGWKLESIKMAIYVAFPVGAFWLFNQPFFFEDVIKSKKEILIPDDPKMVEKVQKTIDALEMRHQRKMEAEYMKYSK